MGEKKATDHFLWSRFLHGGDALLFQVLVNLLFIHGIHRNTSPQILEFYSGKRIV